jgi:hypothetical protein
LGRLRSPRPTVVWGDDGKYHVLDFTFQRRSDGARFLAEMKCEIEFEGYKYPTLTGLDQVAHHQGSAAFTKFLRLARDPGAHSVTIGGKPADINGSILVWGVVPSDRRQAVKDHYGVADVLGVEDLLENLGRWEPSRRAEWVATRRRGLTTSSDGSHIPLESPPMVWFRALVLIKSARETWLVEGAATGDCTVLPPGR